MTTAFTVWTFEDQDGAEQAASILTRLEAEHQIKVVDQAVLSWPGGRSGPTLTRTHDQARHDTGWRVLWGMIARHRRDPHPTGGLGIGKDQLEAIRSQLTEGTSAFMAIIGEGDLDRIAEHVHGLRWTLVDTDLTVPERKTSARSVPWPTHARSGATFQQSADGVAASESDPELAASGPATPQPPDLTPGQRDARPPAREDHSTDTRKRDQPSGWAKLRSKISAGEHRIELLHEATVMVLYVSVIEIAELAALPEGHYADGRVTGPVGGYLLAIVWGTAIGLALAHWFAFRLAAPAFRGQRPKRLDTQIGLAQLSGAVFVAAAASLPVLLFSDVRAQETIGDVPAVLVGAVGYLLARHTGSTRLAAAFYGLTALALGVLVALVKTKLAAH